MIRAWRKLFAEQWALGKRVCVGLDTDIAKIPAEIVEVLGGYQNPLSVVLKYNTGIVNATWETAHCYKINHAFPSGMSLDGSHLVRDTVEYINEVAPLVPVIGDLKRADIGNTNKSYVEEYKLLGVDAGTSNPYLGQEAMQPFLDYGDLLWIFLAKTSNKGAGEFQDLLVDAPKELGELLMFTEEQAARLGIAGVNPKRVPLYQYVAWRVSHFWNANENCGLVAGATWPEDLASVRQIIGPNMPLLVPGVGAQGGDAEKAGRAAGPNSIVNASSSIIYAGKGHDFAEKAAEAALALDQQLRAAA